jgi:hypothetical protein
MASMFSKPKSPATPSQLGAISTDLPMMPGATSLSPLPQAPFQGLGAAMQTPFQPQVQRQPQGGGGNLQMLLQQLGAFGGQ